MDNNSEDSVVDETLVFESVVDKTVVKPSAVVDEAVVDEAVVDEVVVEPSAVVYEAVVDEVVVEPSAVVDETIIDRAIPESFIENHIDPAISESFIKELFIENNNIEMANNEKVNIEKVNIEMVDIKGPVENPLVESPSPIVENPILDEIDISNENQLQVVIQVSNVDTSVHDTSLHDTHLENTIETKKGIDQDTLQRLSVGVQVCLELYRVITSSLLILFVPQICEDHICTTTENLVWETNTYNTALCFNFISMACLVNMYYMELVRENRMIKYLAVNPELANDNEIVGKQLELLPIQKQNKI